MGDRPPTMVEAIEQALVAPVYSFIRLPDADLDISERLRQAFDEFESHDNPAGREAADWLKHCALPEHHTSRTTLHLGNGRIAGYHSLASAHVELANAERDAAGLRSERARVPATRLTWIAKDPRAPVTGRELFLHAVATARRAAQLQASAVLILDAHDDATAEMWLGRPFGLRPLAKAKNGKRLWMPLGAASG